MLDCRCGRDDPLEVNIEGAVRAGGHGTHQFDQLRNRPVGKRSSSLQRDPPRGRLFSVRPKARPVEGRPDVDAAPAGQKVASVRIAARSRTLVRTLTAEWQCMLFRESPLVLRSRCQLPQTVFRDGRRRNPNRQIRPTARMRFSVRHQLQNALFREATPRLRR